MEENEEHNIEDIENLRDDSAERNEEVTSDSNSDMSRATKRKHVLKEILEDDFSPPTGNQQIVRIVAGRGNNLHEVEAPDNSTFLVSMPTKFRKNVWVKRGDFVIVEPIEEGDKVKGEMIRILTAEHVKYFKKDNVWPQAFNDDKKEESDEITENTNRMPVWRYESDDSSDSSKSSGSEL